MDENHQDKTENKLTTTEYKSIPSSLSPQNQRGADQLQNNQMEDTIKQLRDRGYKVTVEYSNTGQLLKVSGEHLQRKTRWDWLQLIIQVIGAIAIATSIIIGVWQFNMQQATDHQKTADEQQQTTLGNYLNSMSNLLIVNKLNESKPGDEIRNVARAQTFAALQNLNPIRKGILLHFLYASNLIFKPSTTKNKASNPIIDLIQADLSGANLNGTNLNATNLDNADLSGANLSGANLSNTILDNADLSGANLSGANLNHASMREVDLSGVNLRGAQLRAVNLTQANLVCKPIEGYGTGVICTDLSYTDLSYADLGYANLTMTYLADANLSYVGMTETNLTSANLTGANLYRAVLFLANLSKAEVTDEQLAKAYMLTGTTMPNGSIHP